MQGLEVVLGPVHMRGPPELEREPDPVRTGRLLRPDASRHQIDVLGGAQHLRSAGPVEDHAEVVADSDRGGRVAELGHQPIGQLAAGGDELLAAVPPWSNPRSAASSSGGPGSVALRFDCIDRCHDAAISERTPVTTVCFA